EVTQLAGQLFAAGEVVDELSQDVGGRDQVLRRGGEQRVEGRVLGGQAEGHAWAPVRSWKGSPDGSDAGPSGSLGARLRDSRSAGVNRELRRPDPRRLSHRRGTRRG